MLRYILPVLLSTNAFAAHKCHQVSVTSAFPAVSEDTNPDYIPTVSTVGATCPAGEDLVGVTCQTDPDSLPALLGFKMRSQTGTCDFDDITFNADADTVLTATVKCCKF